MFNPKYALNNKILSQITAIAEAKDYISRAKILPQQELRLRRQALIRMTHHSTEIEGNALNMGQVEALYDNKKIDAPDRDIYEVKNYLNALKYIEKVVADDLPITKKVILKIHKLVTNKTLDSKASGHYRTGPIYIVKNQIGKPREILYTGPEAKRVPALMKNFLAWLTESKKEDINPVIVAAVAHMEIAAIHPFNDGNGRTARAVATLILYKRGYDFRRLFALEDYYNTDRTSYYDAINLGNTYDARQKDMTPWLEYFITGFREEIDSVKDRILSLSTKSVDSKIKSQIYLTPEQLKIIDLLDKVGRISANDVEKALSCPKRTAQLLLQKLVKIKMIKMIGKGKSTSYISNS
jgi:Fic family protein